MEDTKLPDTLLKAMKRQNDKIVMLTCYDYPTALCLDSSGIDIALVGDSVGTNYLGYQDVSEVTMDDIVHHTKAVRRGLKNTMLLADLPYRSYETIAEAKSNARRLINAGADMVKLEGGLEYTETVAALVNDGIRVMSHIGHKPQFHAEGSKRVVGSLASEAITVYEDAVAMQKAGASALLVECVPALVAEHISNGVEIPTIGIGSGNGCDGQVLVITDLLGWHHMPFRIKKEYENFQERTITATKTYIHEVKNGMFPAEEHSFKLKKTEFGEFEKTVETKS